MDTLDFARKYLQPFKQKGSEIVPTYCPFCKGGQSNDKYTFALNIHSQTYNCKRGSCGKQGHFFELCKEYGEKLDNQTSYEVFKPKREYKKPKTEIKDVSNQAEKYLETRKISSETMKKLNIGTDNNGNIVFPYYENNELVFVKFRPSKKVKHGERKAWREEGGKPILFNMDNCTHDKPLIITEGEIDTLSVYECGLDNAVSIPSGAEDFTWIDICWDWLNKFEKIIICGDMDEAGKKMTKKVIQKLGSYRVSVVELSNKDANEVLYFHGKEELARQILSAKDVPIFGLIDLSTVESLDIINLPIVPTGIETLDEQTGGSILGDVSVWSGKSGEGKSTLMSQILIDTIDKGFKVCAYSGELSASRFKYWIDLQIAGKRHIEKYFCNKRNKDIYYLSQETRSKIEKWYQNKFFLYDNTISKDAEESSILKVFEYAVKRYDCKVFLVDNLMTANSESTSSDDFYLRQVTFVKELIAFANKYQVHIHLVAHPKKTKGGIEKEDISGRAEITNLAHNVYKVEKQEDNQDFDVIVKILKNRWEGANATVGLRYCPISRRLYPKSKGSLKEYGWNKEETPDWVLDNNQDILPF